MEETIEALKQQVRASWSGEAGERGARELEASLREILAEYASALGIGEPELLAALEKARRYQAAGFYQRSNFPRLEHVTLLPNMREFKKRYPSGRFRCPACGGISTNPAQCNSGRQTGESDARRPCDAKSHRPERTDWAMRVVFRDGFLERPVVFEVFTPIEVEGVNHGQPPAWPT